MDFSARKCLQKVEFAVAFVAFLVSGCFIQVFAQSQTSSPVTDKDSELAIHLSHSFQDLANRLSPSVVEVLVTGFGSSSDDNEQGSSALARERGVGSGVIVDSDGFIITNAHVVKGADRIRVALTPSLTDEPQVESLLKAHGRILPARVIGVSKLIDLAVLKVEATGLPALPILRYTSVQKGQLVLAFGSPEGFQNSVAFGLVSSVLRQRSPENQMVYIQMDAAINPGNSGGPLVDMQGNVVGINTFIYSKSGGSEGLGFAIPGGVARFAYEEIRKYGRLRQRTIGADLQSLTPELVGGLGLTTETGVMIADVEPGGPAQSAGLETGDVIVSLDGSPVGNLPHFTLGLYMMGSANSARLEILRAGKKIEANVAVVEPHTDPQRLSEMAQPSKDIISSLGIVGITVTPEVASFLGGLRMPSGVAVAALVSSQLAVESGLAEGDVIHSLNHAPITTVDELRAAYGSLKPEAPVAMLVERGGRLTYLSFAVE
jgi:serine protease Do